MPPFLSLLGLSSAHLVLDKFVDLVLRIREALHCPLAFAQVRLHPREKEVHPLQAFLDFGFVRDRCHLLECLL